MPASAAGVNSFEQGEELHATGTLDITAAQIRAAEYLMIREARRHGWGINLSRFPTPEFVDAVFANPAYDTTTGLFHPVAGRRPYLRKIDLPQELDQVMVYAASDLQAKLETRGL